MHVGKTYYLNAFAVETYTFLTMYLQQKLRLTNSSLCLLHTWIVSNTIKLNLRITKRINLNQPNFSIIE